MARRTRYEIFRDTLETIRRRGSKGITRISYGANMPVDRTNEVISFLAKRGLINKEDYDNITGYRLTARGGEFLQALKTVNEYIEE